MKKTIEEYWVEYAKNLLPKDAGPTQCRETERAFYGGVKAMMTIMAELGEKEVSEDEVIEILQTLQKEMNVWIKNKIMQTTSH